MIIYNGIDQQSYETLWRNYSWLMSSSGGYAIRYVRNHYDPAPGNSGNGKQFHNKNVPKNQAMKNSMTATLLFRKRMKKASDCVCPTQKLKKLLSPHTWPCLELFGPQVKKDYTTIIALFTRQLSPSKWQSKWGYTPVYGTKP